jgi:hypothetical protein
MSGSSPLRAALDTVIAEQGGSLKSITVLAMQNDPFRVDIPPRHRDGEWLATTARDLGLGDRRIHLRGLHYMAAVAERPKPDGTPYRNTDPEWEWLQGDAAKAARWLGYMPFDQIADQRNPEPEIREFTQPEPWAHLSAELNIEIPDSIRPELVPVGFRGVQPYKLIFFGEKSSLADVLSPLAAPHEADLYLSAGEISDTLIYRMAVTGAADGRPMAVLCFSDADPAGWQMPISIGRKLQAFKALGTVQVRSEDAFGNRRLADADTGALDFAVYRVALTPQQVPEYGLPSTPLKDTEKRADKWRTAWGVEQTEIDALASLRPDLLEQITRTALRGFYDYTLAGRVRQYRDEWLGRAREILAPALTRQAAAARTAERQLATMREQVRELNEQLHIDVSASDLPPIELPEADDPGGSGTPLLDSRWDFAEQCRRLIASKAYRQDGGAP